jgi:hypothetical protein
MITVLYTHKIHLPSISSSNLRICNTHWKTPEDFNTILTYNMKELSSKLGVWRAAGNDTL